MAVTRIPIPAWEKAQRHDDRLDLSLAEIDLPVRTVNCLEEEGIFTVRDLLNCTPQRLLEIPNLGEKTLGTIYAALEKMGFCRLTHPEDGAKDGFDLLRVYQFTRVIMPRLRNLCAVVVVGGLAVTAGMLRLFHCDPTVECARGAEPTLSESAKAAIGFDSICFSDSGLYSGSGTGKWIRVVNDRRIEARPLYGHSPSKWDEQSKTYVTIPFPTRVTEAELRLLSEQVKVIKWSSLQESYPSAAADVLIDKFAISINGKTYRTSMDAFCSGVPPALRSLGGYLDRLYERYAATDYIVDSPAFHR
jgi:DNA-directed RNA polymerase subunit alpha